jgi:acyl-CoA hydrolase
VTALAGRTGARTLGVEGFLRGLAPGERVFLQGAAGEPVALMEALAGGLDPGLSITANFVPGINPLRWDGLNARTRFSSVFMQPGLGAAEAEGRFRHVPVSYAGFVKLLREELAFDVAVVQVSPPDARGMASLGPAAEFAPLAMTKARRIAAFVNPRLPALPGSPSIALDRCDLVVEADAPLREYLVGEPSAEAQTIAAHVARFVPDGAALQLGLGKVPDALYPLIAGRRGLRLQSGMLSDGVMLLADRGCLAPDHPHVACVHVGSRAYYAWLAGPRDILTRGCEETHDVARLSAVDGLVAVNTALEVDLLGQANLETAGGRQVSGVGGAPDYARAARLSRGGVSIIALPASYGGGRGSRIVARLGGPVSIPRHDIDVVVTEYGAADLRGASTEERARRIAAVAAPQHRAALEAGLDELCNAPRGPTP